MYHLKNGYQIISGLCQSGLNIAFCDESETSGEPRKGLAPNLRIFCALVMSSQAYAECKRRLESHLSLLGGDLKEFHSTDIVNPGPESPWHDICFRERVSAFKFLGKLLVEHTERLFYCFILREQYEKMRRQETRTIPIGYMHALKIVFLKTLIKYLAAGDKTLTIVLDQDRPIEGLRIEQWSGTESFYEGGIISVPSHSVPGLQLADHAAFTITRYRLKRDKLIDGESNPFDEQVAYSLAELKDRVENLLSAVL